MKVNVESIEFRLSLYRWKNKDTFSLIFRFKLESNEEIEFYIPENALEKFRECLRNESDFYPSFNDGYTKITPYNHVIEVLKLERYLMGNQDNSGVFKEWNIIFPGDELDRSIANFMAFNENPKNEWISEIKKYYAPRVKLNLKGIESEDLEKDKSKHLNLSECIDRLKSIAENRSDGNWVLIDLSYDFASRNENPRPYYFVIYDPKKEGFIMEGGIIAHEKNDGFEYRIHT